MPFCKQLINRWLFNWRKSLG